MKQPPSIQPAPRQGPAYDPMDRLVQDLQNIQSFLARLEDAPRDLHYANTHLPQILGLRKSMLQQIELLNQDPYNYPSSRLISLKQETEKIFLEIEGAIGAINPWNESHFKKFTEAAEKAIAKFDGELTP